MTPKTQPLFLGAILKQGAQRWKIDGIGMTGGERYYWLTNVKDKSVAMWPATMVEEIARTGKGERT